MTSKPSFIRSSLRFAANLASVFALMLATGIALFFVHAYLDRAGLFLSIAGLLVVLCAGSWLPGQALTRSFDRFDSAPFARGNPRLMSIWAAIFTIYAVFWIGALAPIVLPEKGTEDLVREDVPIREGPYRITSGEDLERLLITHAHHPSGPPGVTIVDQVTDSTEFHEFGTSCGHYGSYMPHMDLAIVHDTGLFATHLLEVSTGALTTRFDPRRAEVWQSYYDARIDALYVLDNTYAELFRTPPEHFVERGLQDLTAWPVGLDRPDGFTLHPSHPDRVFVRGKQHHSQVVELDTLTGKRQSTRVPAPFWRLSPDFERRRLYVSRWPGIVTVIDSDTLEIERHVFVGGAPRPVTPLPSLNAVAVGMFLGHRVLILDDETFEVKVRLRACLAVRDFLFDEARQLLWWIDDCGLHRLRFPG